MVKISTIIESNPCPSAIMILIGILRNARPRILHGFEDEVIIMRPVPKTILYQAVREYRTLVKKADKHEK
jgi:hypothetical protein